MTRKNRQNKSQSSEETKDQNMKDDCAVLSAGAHDVPEERLSARSAGSVAWKLRLFRNVSSDDGAGHMKKPSFLRKARERISKRSAKKQNNKLSNNGFAVAFLPLPESSNTSTVSHRDRDESVPEKKREDSPIIVLVGDEGFDFSSHSVSNHGSKKRLVLVPEETQEDKLETVESTQEFSSKSSVKSSPDDHDIDSNPRSASVVEHSVPVNSREPAIVSVEVISGDSRRVREDHKVEDIAPSFLTTDDSKLNQQEVVAPTCLLESIRNDTCSTSSSQSVPTNSQAQAIASVEVGSDESVVVQDECKDAEVATLSTVSEGSDLSQDEVRVSDSALEFVRNEPCPAPLLKRISSAPLTAKGNRTNMMSSASETDLITILPRTNSHDEFVHLSDSVALKVDEFSRFISHLTGPPTGAKNSENQEEQGESKMHPKEAALPPRPMEEDASTQDKIVDEIKFEPTADMVLSKSPPEMKDLPAVDVNAGGTSHDDKSPQVYNGNGTLAVVSVLDQKPLLAVPEKQALETSQYQTTVPNVMHETVIDASVHVHDNVPETIEGGDPNQSKKQKRLACQRSPNRVPRPLKVAGEEKSKKGESGVDQKPEHCQVKKSSSSDVFLSENEKSSVSRDEPFAAAQEPEQIAQESKTDTSHPKNERIVTEDDSFEWGSEQTEEAACTTSHASSTVSRNQNQSSYHSGLREMCSSDDDESGFISMEMRSNLSLLSHESETSSLAAHQEVFEVFDRRIPSALRTLLSFGQRIPTELSRSPRYKPKDHESSKQKCLEKEQNREKKEDQETQPLQEAQQPGQQLPLGQEGSSFSDISFEVTIRQKRSWFLGALPGSSNQDFEGKAAELNGLEQVDTALTFETLDSSQPGNKNESLTELPQAPVSFHDQFCDMLGFLTCSEKQKSMLQNVDPEVV